MIQYLPVYDNNDTFKQYTMIVGQYYTYIIIGFGYDSISYHTIYSQNAVGSIKNRDNYLMRKSIFAYASLPPYPANLESKINQPHSIKLIQQLIYCRKKNGSKKYTPIVFLEQAPVHFHPVPPDALDDYKAFLECQLHDSRRFHHKTFCKKQKASYSSRASGETRRKRTGVYSIVID